MKSIFTSDWLHVLVNYKHVSIQKNSNSTYVYNNILNYLRTFKIMNLYMLRYNLFIICIICIIYIAACMRWRMRGSIYYTVHCGRRLNVAMRRHFLVCKRVVLSNQFIFSYSNTHVHYLLSLLLSIFLYHFICLSL